MTAILGLSAFYHDSAACLVVDGEIVAAAQEERFTRVKHDPGFPRGAVSYCLREGDLRPDQLDFVAFYEKPLVKFDRLLETYLYCAPRGFASFRKAMPLWLHEKLWLPELIRIEVARAGGIDDDSAAKREARRLPFKLLFGDHHESHAASAFYPSPFENAAILTVDGVGEWATASVGVGRGSEITLLRELRFPDSLGLLYSAFTYYIGFRVNSGEYKVMGLAPYGEPSYVGLIKEGLLDVAEDGSLRMHQEYFGYAHGLTMTNGRFAELFGGEPRAPESQLGEREMDLARSIQEITEEVILKMARFAGAQSGMRRLCLAGGVALNCVANGRLLREGLFDDLWVQPAAGDAGGAVGVALAVWHRFLGRPRTSPDSIGAWRPRTRGDELPPYADGMKGALLGPSYGEKEIAGYLEARGAPYRRAEPDQVADEIAGMLEAGKVVGLFQGRMEFGPRALGARSILGDPRSPKMQSLMNLKIKFREGFRPFAPSVLREHVDDWFELDCDSPYMLLVAGVAAHRRRSPEPGDENLRGLDKLKVLRSEIPAVTHVDCSARIQTVRRETNRFFWEVIEAFRRRTGCPVVVNTSFNVRGEPIVCSPADAYRCFMRTEIDALVIETFVLTKADQPPFQERGDWRAALSPD